jgi:four helix bundle protein
MAKITHFRDLKAWQVARELRNKVRSVTRTWPADEKFRLCDQIIRSTRSVTANIAEGYGRFYERDNVRFCRIARGSLYETQDHLITAYDDGILSEEDLKELLDLSERAIMLINGYIKYLVDLSGGRYSAVEEPLASYGRDEVHVPASPAPDCPLIADL